MAKPRPEGLDKPWVKPLIDRMSRGNVWLYQRTGGLLGGTWRVGAAFPRGVPICLLTSTGRKSGLRRTTPLLFIHEGESIIVVASTGGLPKNPAWYYNLKADPNCEIQVRRTTAPYRAREANDEERAMLWPKLVAHYADFESYDAWTDRVIPVMICDPRE